jgi:hypothetical protein
VSQQFRSRGPKRRPASVSLSSTADPGQGQLPILRRYALGSGARPCSVAQACVNSAPKKRIRAE